MKQYNRNQRLKVLFKSLQYSRNSSSVATAILKMLGAEIFIKAGLKGPHEDMKRRYQVTLI